MTTYRFDIVDIDGTLNVDGAATFQSSAKSVSPTAGVGYGTGAGGQVTQLTSKATNVTLDKVCGQITMNNSGISAGSEIAFTLVNSTIAATDVVVVCMKGGGTTGAYGISVTNVSAGSCDITISNLSGGSLSEAIILNFAVLKAVTA